MYTRIEAAAARQDATAFEYLIDFFAGADWVLWLAVMMPYSVFFFLVDSHATWRVIRWFNASGLRFGHMLPIRASAYILSLVNEQVGKGAMTLYLLKRHNTPGWETLSSMIFLGLMEVYQLLMFSAIGVALNFHLLQEASKLLPLDWIFPIILGAAAIYLPLHIAWFRAGAGGEEGGDGLRNKPLLRAFRRARPIHYLLVVLFKAPNLLGAVVVYTVALELFQVQASLGQMLAFPARDLPRRSATAAVPRRRTLALDGTVPRLPRSGRLQPRDAHLLRTLQRLDRRPVPPKGQQGAVWLADCGTAAAVGGKAFC